jgi:hypothetical protein
METHVSGEVVHATALPIFVFGKGPSSKLILFVTPRQLSLRQDEATDDDDA